jgi:predicted O-methyltransferase YrrM
MSYIDSTRWFESTELKRELKNHVSLSQKHTILEIGSYEGISSCFFSDFLLLHPESTLDCVDPFLPEDPMTPNVSEATYRTFLANIEQSSYPEKVTHHKMLSSEYLATNKKMYDIVYLDGSHLYADVLADLEGVFPFVVSEGIVWCDDYRSYDSVYNAITEFCEKHHDELEIVHKDGQLAFRKL